MRKKASKDIKNRKSTNEIKASSLGLRDWFWWFVVFGFYFGFFFVCFFLLFLYLEFFCFSLIFWGIFCFCSCFGGGFGGEGGFWWVGYFNSRV